MPFYNYKCKNGHVMEQQLRKYEEKVIPCSECGEDADRMFDFKFNATGLPNGFIGNRRRTSLDKHIDPNKFVSENAEKL